MYVYVQVASLRLMTTRVRELVNIPLQLAFFPDQNDKHEAIERARRVQRMRALVLSGMRKLRRVQVMRGAKSEGGSETEAASPSFPQFLYHALRLDRGTWENPGNGPALLRVHGLDATLVASAVSLTWLSVWPDQHEWVYPPLTSLMPIRQQKIEVVSASTSTPSPLVSDRQSSSLVARTYAETKLLQTFVYGLPGQDRSMYVPRNDGQGICSQPIGHTGEGWIDVTFLSFSSDVQVALSACASGRGDMGDSGDVITCKASTLLGLA